jgi:hypothetical protein
MCPGSSKHSRVRHSRPTSSTSGPSSGITKNSHGKRLLGSIKKKKRSKRNDDTHDEWLDFTDYNNDTIIDITLDGGNLALTNEFLFSKLYSMIYGPDAEYMRYRRLIRNDMRDVLPKLGNDREEWLVKLEKAIKYLKMDFGSEDIKNLKEEGFLEVIEEKVGDDKMLKLFIDENKTCSQNMESIRDYINWVSKKKKTVL